VKGGAADILCSDYHPASLLHAVFELERQGLPLERAAAMASLHPAQAIGRGHDIGSLEPGKAADLIVVRKWRDVPLVTATVAGGTLVHTSRDMRPAT
jgi:alpha-D-ribose 1-methylphosphonate 5-triphosphate diphosphatase